MDVDTSIDISIGTSKNTGTSDNIDTRIGFDKSANIDSTDTIKDKNIRELEIRKKIRCNRIWNKNTFS